jgi:hypothetical protein
MGREPEKSTRHIRFMRVAKNTKATRRVKRRQRTALDSFHGGGQKRTSGTGREMKETNRPIRFTSSAKIGISAVGAK